MFLFTTIPGFFSVTECSTRLQFGCVLLGTILQVSIEPFLAISTLFAYHGTDSLKFYPVSFPKITKIDIWHLQMTTNFHKSQKGLNTDLWDTPFSKKKKKKKKKRV